MAKAAAVIRNALQKFSFSEQARSASTPEDHKHVVDRVEAELADARLRLANLENRRESILLEGGDINTFHGELANGREVVETLQATYREAIRRHEEAKAAKYSRDLEAGVQIVRDVDVPGAEQALLDWHRATLAAVEAGERLAAHRQAIQGNDLNVKAHDRPDLVIDYNAIRTRVAAELPSEHTKEPMPVRIGRGGDPDLEEGRALFLSRTRDGQLAYAKWQERMRGTINEGVIWKDHETEEAYALRVQSWIGRQNSASTRRREDPFKAAGEKAIKLIKSLIDDREAYDRDRNGREIQIQTYVDPNGDQHIKTVFTDGRRQPRLPGERAI